MLGLVAFSGAFMPIALDYPEKTCYESAMKTSDAHTSLRISKIPQSLEEVLEVCFAENERLTKLVDEQRQEIITLQKENVALQQENLALRERLNRNSTNSNQPPSQDSPFRPPQKEQKQAGSASKEKASKESAPSAPKKPRPYHKGASQQILTADETLPCAIGPCSCGCHEYKKARKIGVHQWLELRERPWYVVHILLEEVECVRCGKTRKGHVPAGYETGYGPGLTACIATLNAGATVSWQKIADFFSKSSGFPSVPARSASV